ncbi:transcription initiation factor TFIID subunit 5-like isoform X1 [Hibiscus syriacus]|uniref:Transcription initiation factor TFIID subunit 5-like isoform X1 n=1 Tax=Hibiscus syriacus TaxID=106335 RepID=A0A6A2WE19_HIBSY|nr:transcription initiation factor TFIID subunit 5-like isoform X1 [Hibiscus syriacus]
MAASEKELELQLMEAGNRLVEPPSSVDELIPLLDQVESCLSRVEQSPSQSMQNALSPSRKALIAEHLFRHPDDDVKVAVAACISEITRITAPDAPYDDDQMRDVFQLIVSSFENLSDKCSRSYIKRTSILETVAKVRSCVVMLDLECDDLIVEMFQHFLKAIRDHHPQAVFTSMVTIMSLVLEESEDIPVELLFPVLASVKIDNEEILPVARRLAEEVLKNCASKLQPYLTQAVENLGISYDDYSSVVASVCQVTAHAVYSNDAASGKHVDDKSILVEAPLEKAAQEDKQIPEQVDPANKKSPKAVVCNGIFRTAEDDSLADLNSVKKEEGDHIADKSKNETSPVAEPNISEAEEVVNSGPTLEKNTHEKERKSDSKLTEPSDSSHVDGKAVETSKDKKTDSKDDVGAPRLSIGGVLSSENRRETDDQHSSLKATKEELNDVASPTPSGTDSHSTRAARPKKKESVSKETTSSLDDVSKSNSDSEAKNK